MGLNESEYGVTQLRVDGDFREVTTYQREVMFAVQLADSLNALHRSFITKMAPQCVS